jgi:hypothetical protein
MPSWRGFERPNKGRQISLKKQVSMSLEVEMEKVKQLINQRMGSDLDKIDAPLLLNP